MREHISVTLTGHDTPFALDDDAHAALKDYLQTTRSRLQGDPDREDVIGDLESSIGERLLARPAAQEQVSGSELRAILAAIGPVRPVDQSQPDHRTVGAPPRGRFWCRIQEGRWFGGICLGVAAYGDFRVDWVRTVVLLLTLFTGGLLGFAYLVLVLVLPPVPTVADYKRMRDAPR